MYGWSLLFIPWFFSHSIKHRIVLILSSLVDVLFL